VSVQSFVTLHNNVHPLRICAHELAWTSEVRRGGKARAELGQTAVCQQGLMLSADLLGDSSAFRWLQSHGLLQVRHRPVRRRERHCPAVSDQRSHGSAIVDPSTSLHHYDHRLLPAGRLVTCGALGTHGMEAVLPSAIGRGQSLGIGREEKRLSAGWFLLLPRPLYAENNE
jgi:hypothetical protein